MTARPDLVKSMNANSYPYELHSDSPFVPPIDYPFGELNLKQRRRPPSPPTDYYWDKPYPFVSYGGQQNFHKVEKRKPEPPIDYLDLEPVVPVQRPQPPPRELPTSRFYKATKASQPYQQDWVQHNNKIRSGFNCADCPICKAMAAAKGALVPPSSMNLQQRNFQQQVPISPSSRPYGGIPVFPPSRSPQRSYTQRRILFEDEFHPPRNRSSSEDDFDHDVKMISEDDFDHDRVNGVPYQRERRQLAYMDDMASRGAFMVKVMIDRVARTPQELTISKGEVLEVLNDQKSWWKCCNVTGQVGFVPFNVLKQMRQSEVIHSSGFQVPVPDYNRRRR